MFEFTPSLVIMKITLSLLLISFLVLLPLLVEAFSITGKVVQVKDGDTVVVSSENGGDFFICRLYGIDAPEIDHRGKSGQPYGDESTQKLKGLILGRVVDVKTTGSKTHEREICFISFDGTDINLEMVRSGSAWAFLKYLRKPYKDIYIDAEQEARAARRGLWKEESPIPPWDFRYRTKKVSKFQDFFSGCLIA